MTSLPIVWYTMYDYAYNKEDRDKELIELIPEPELAETHDEIEKALVSYEKVKREIYEKKEELMKDKDYKNNSFMANPDLYKIGIED